MRLNTTHSLCRCLAAGLLAVLLLLNSPPEVESRGDTSNTLMQILQHIHELDDVELYRLFGLDMLFKRLRKSRGVIPFRPFTFDPRHPWRSIILGNRQFTGRGFNPAVWNQINTITKNIKAITATSGESSILSDLLGENLGDDTKATSAVSSAASAASAAFSGATSGIANRAKLLANLLPFIPLPVPIPVTQKVAESIMNVISGGAASTKDALGKAASTLATQSLNSEARKAALTMAASALPAVTSAPHMYMNPAASLLLNSPLIPINPLSAKIQSRLGFFGQPDEELSGNSESAAYQNFESQRSGPVQSSPQTSPSADQLQNDQLFHQIIEREQFARLLQAEMAAASGTDSALGQESGPQFPFNNAAALDELIKLAALEEAVSRVAALTEAEHAEQE